MSRLEEIRKKLERSEQQHLLRFYESLNPSEKELYEETLQKLDYKSLNNLYSRANESYSSDIMKLDEYMKPLPTSQFETEENSSAEQLHKYYDIGLREISKGAVGVLLMAGGQGTRLGVTYPKGMYSVDLLSKKTLFQLQAERIQQVQKLANQRHNSTGIITWYIMTSGPTIEQTIKYLEKNNYFGLSKDNVIIFQQGLFPCFDFTGNIIMENKDKLAMAPDGNGGIYKALKDNGILNMFKSRGTKHVHVHSVDNILTKVADPVFIGYCVDKNADCGAKVVQKAGPTEAVGVVCLVENKVQVVEYSEITEETANLRNADGSLVFNAGNICNHYFSTSFLDELADKEMPLHVAKKKIPFIDLDGQLVKPTVPNGIKIEKFVFDVFQFSRRFVMWEVPRDSEFSALKNADDAGKDCPMTAKRDLYRLHKKYLEKANAVVSGDEIEISPLLSYAGEGLENFNGKTVESPFHLDLANTPTKADSLRNTK